MAEIFISYSREDEDVVSILVDDLKELGHEPWFDQDLRGGHWWDQILESIRACEVFVFVLAPESLSSTACEREYRYAADLGKPILPIMVAEGVSTNRLPPSLAALQIVDYRKPQERDSALRLARAVSSAPPAAPLPDPLPDPPDAPIPYLSSLTERIGVASDLSFKEQSALVLELKRALRDPGTSSDARVLLERLKERRDLLASIDQEIDDLLSSELPDSRSPRHKSDKAPAFSIPLTPEEIGAMAEARRNRIRRRWVLPPVAGAIAGAFLAAIFCIILSSKPDPSPYLFAGSICGALAGAVGGSSKKRIMGASVGALVGLGLFYVLFFISTDDGNILAADPFPLAVGIFAGLVVGAICGLSPKVWYSTTAGFLVVSVVAYAIDKNLEFAGVVAWSLGAIPGAIAGATIR